MTSFCVPVEQGMMKMYQDFTVQVAVLFSLCVFQRLFLTTHTHTHTHKGTGKCKTSCVDGHCMFILHDMVPRGSINL